MKLAPTPGNGLMFFEHSNIPLDSLQRIKLRLMGKNNRRRRLAVILSFVGTLLGLAIIGAAWFVGDRITDAKNLSIDQLGDAAEYVIYAIFPVLLGLYFWSRRTWQEPPLVRALLAEGLCPSCTYSLRGMRRADDGLAECPECGAAWRMPRRYFAAS